MPLFALGTPPKDYKLQWQDEFEGNKLDESKWQLTFPQRWDVTNSLKNCRVHDGTLRIIVNTENGKHTSSMISTEKSLNKTYGYWEIKAKFNDQPGTWSDAWLYTRKMENEEKGVEIDIFEHRFSNYEKNIVESIMSYGVFYGGYNGKGYTKGSYFELNPCLQWHTFGLLATPEKYVWFLNGQQVAEIKDTRDEALFIILSTELHNLKGVKWVEKPVDFYKHETMEVDYVRYYEKEKKVEWAAPFATQPLITK